MYIYILCVYIYRVCVYIYIYIHEQALTGRTATSAPYTRPTQRLSRPPPIQKLGAENHMLQLNIQCS